MQKLLLSLVCICIATLLSASSKPGFNLKVKIKGYDNDTLMLGYYFGDKQYIKDTAFKKGDVFEFNADTLLESGMYMLVLKPDNNFVQILIDDTEQKFTLETDTADLVKNLKLKNAPINKAFYAYMETLGNLRIEAEAIQKQLRETQDSAKQNVLNARLRGMDAKVKTLQESTIAENKSNILGLLINWTLDIEIPEFTGSKEEQDEQAFKYYKTHYWDLYDLKDDRSSKLPLFYPKIDRYIQKLTFQIPDSISASLDYLLEKMNPAGANYKFVVSHYLNFYANSKFVGLDAIYVHLVEKYYASGKTPWINEEALAKMVRDAKALKPLLIGKLAPNFTVFTKDSVPVTLHNIKSPYTVLLFWAPDCGHCKQTMPAIVKFYEAYKSKGVELLATCTKHSENEPACWDMVKEKQMEKWINASDKHYYSNFRAQYDLTTTPQIYILDENKKILTKKIGAEQLGEVMDKIMEHDKSLKSKG